VVNTAVREVVFASDAKSSEDARLTAAARVSFLVCILIAVVLGATSPLWLPVAFGEGFSAAVPTTILLLAAVAIGIPGSVAGAGLSSRGYPQLRSLALVVACVVNVLMLLVLVPPLGAFGAALSTLVGNLVSSNMNIVALRRRFGVPVLDFYRIRPADVRLLVTASLRILKRGGRA
jgi:O-antigen/teichoic acid export membrane protein